MDARPRPAKIAPNVDTVELSYPDGFNWSIGECSKPLPEPGCGFSGLGHDRSFVDAAKLSILHHDASANGGRPHRAPGDTEEQMAVDVRGGQRRRRIVVRHNHIGTSAGNQLAQCAARSEEHT